MHRTRTAVRRRARRRTRIGWATLTVAPWCLAAGLLVSMGAEAGQEPPPGRVRLALADPAPPMPGDLVPPADAAEGPGFALPPAGDEPRSALEDGGPAPEPTAGGDPLAGVRPTFSAALDTAPPPEDPAAALVFGPGEAAPGGAGFAAVAVAAPWDDPAALKPLPHDLRVTTPPSHAADASDLAEGLMAPAAQDAAAPVAAAPAPPAATGGGPVGIAPPPDGPRHPDYAALLETARSAPEQRCLAQAVYFEARSESEEGQAAVAQVVLNRATSGLYPSSVCGVVFQNQRRRNACQFSFACDGHALRVSEAGAWDRAVRIARAVTEGSTYVADVGDSTHYHTRAVRPSWARALHRADVIGSHVFYTARAGQT